MEWTKIVARSFQIKVCVMALYFILGKLQIGIDNIWKLLQQLHPLDFEVYHHKFQCHWSNVIV